MAELLVNVQTGEVVYVAEDGHKWGALESREEYDRRVAAGDPPKVIRREIEVTPGQKDAHGRIVKEELRRVLGESVEVAPPPSRLGVIHVPGPASDWMHLTERERILDGDEERRGGRLRTLDIASDADAIRSGTVTMERASLEQRVRTRSARGN